MGPPSPNEFRPGRPRGRGQTAKRRTEILRAAVAHFARSGYAEADLNAVAADAGCAKGTLYNYFPSKCELFAASVDQAMRELIAFIDIDSDDVVGRMVATHLGTVLGKQIVVDNRGGAGGTVGTDIVSKAPNDGYTLGVVSIAHAVNPWLYKLPYDPKAFAPVGLMATGTNVLVIHPSLPVRSVKELIELAKQKPGELQ